MNVNIKFPITIRYYLDADGREASLLGGGDGCEIQTVSGEITLDQAKQAGFFVARHGGLNVSEINLADGGRSNAWGNPLERDDVWQIDITKATYNSPQGFGELWKRFLSIVQERKRTLAKAAAERAELEARFLAGEIPAGQWDDGSIYLEGQRWQHRYKDGPIYLEGCRRIEAERAERERAHAEARERQAAEAAAVAEAKAAQIAAWVAEYGDQNQKERFAAGMLFRHEAVEGIKNLAFVPLDGFKRYERVTVDDLDCDCRDWGGGLDCETADNVPATADQWDRIKEIRERLPEDATVTLRKHSCRCNRTECDAVVERYSIYVKIGVGAFTFHRNFAA